MKSHTKKVEFLPYKAGELNLAIEKHLRGEGAQSCEGRSPLAHPTGPRRKESAKRQDFSSRIHIGHAEKS